MPIVTNTSSSDGSLGVIASTEMDSKVIISNWSLSSLSSPSLRFLLADLLLRRSLLLERRRDLGFPRFLFRLLVVVILWGLERQTFAQWLSLWQFLHLDPYDGHLSRGLRGCSRPQLLHFNFVGFLSLLCLFTFPFMAFMSFFSLSSCSSCDVVVSYVLAMSMASRKVSCSPFSSNLSWVFVFRSSDELLDESLIRFNLISESAFWSLIEATSQKNHRRIRQSSVWIAVAGILLTNGWFLAPRAVLVAPIWSMGYFCLRRLPRSSCYRFLNLACQSIARWMRFVLSPFSVTMARWKLGRSID